MANPDYVNNITNPYDTNTNSYDNFSNPNNLQRTKLIQYINAKLSNNNNNNNNIENYQHINSTFSNHNYLHVIPILKQQKSQNLNNQPVSLSMANATNAAAQATQRYINYTDRSVNNYTIEENQRPNQITHRRDLSNTLPNLFNAQKEIEPVSPEENYRTVTEIIKHDSEIPHRNQQQERHEKQKSHRINRRADYEFRNISREKLGEYLPVTRYVETENKEESDEDMDDNLIVTTGSEHKSRSMESSNQNTKRTTSV